jgi:hypothetical protein
MLLGTFSATRNPKSPVISTMKYTTIILALIAPLLGEGAVCLAMAAPIVYPVAALTAHLAADGRRKKLRAVVLLPFAFAILQKRPMSELPRMELSDSFEVAAPVERVWNAFDKLVLPLDEPLPLLLRLGFPQPQVLLGGGVHVGAERRVVFDNGIVVATVVESDPGRSFKVRLWYEKPGHEFFDRWIHLEDATFDFTPLPGGRTRVSHTTHYRRLLEPAFYFGPLEEYGVHLMHRYLLATFTHAIERS